ncbi:MAG: hypothetical protein EAZ99_03770 [Alphaproteobacteria bacterium]|nr:MAG: hypothetical protein EAZ99_03770 [Alphaproteobacteria bacterium]
MSAPTLGAGSSPITGRTLWVTRGRPKVDRVACAWLVRRCVDPSAVLLFTAPERRTRSPPAGSRTEAGQPGWSALGAAKSRSACSSRAH